MKLAETVRSRCALILVSAAFGATAIVAASHTCTKRPITKSMTITKVKPWRGCHQRVAAPPPPVVHETTGSDYRDVLMTARPAFEACMKHQPEGVVYSMRAQIDATGRVRSVDVRGESEDLTKVDLHVVKCMEGTVAGLRFPATEATVSTTFITPARPTLIANEPQ